MVQARAAHAESWLMDQTPTLGPSGQAAGGLHLPMSDKEQKCYSELFSMCQAEGSARLAAGSSKVGELFRASKLHADTLHQITELCGAKHVGYFGPAQFFIALKLIAVAQTGLPVCLESIKSELPLPRFFFMKSLTDGDLKHGVPTAITETQGLNSAAKEKSSFKSSDEGEKQSDTKTIVSPKKSPPISPQNYGHSLFQSRSDHHNSATAATAAAAAYEARQPSLLQQDGHLPLNYENQPAPLQLSLSRLSLSAERESLDDSSNYSEDLWRITEEQREYYTNQFLTLQPDLKSLISGSVAKNFFTKSKLPISELSHIWDLSDVDCDGALTLAEFCAAFHLIVARKNGYEVPDTLPRTLLAEIIQAVSLKPISGDAYEGCRGTSTVCQIRKELETVCEDPATSEPLILFDEETSATEPSSAAAPLNQNELTQDSAENDKQGSKLSFPSVEVKSFKSFKSSVHQESYTLKTRPRSRSYSNTSIEETMKKVEDPPTPPPRPQKTHSRASSLDLNRIIQQNSPAARAGWVPPPALPPRPCISQNPHHTSNTDQKMPIQQPNFADFRSQEQREIELHPQTNKMLPQTEESSPAKKEILLSQPPMKPLRRKFLTESQVLENHELSSVSSVTSSVASLKSHPSVQKQPSKRKKAIQTAIRKNKEANAVLARLNSELQQQLKEVHQERIALETQLEQLRPVTVL
ncbi:ralBP1-associated Eps domain-containing protein 2 isoform X2 [Xenopus laevis]|uniref:RalBP1-associated Eps domain-containing protein 2 isoform X2 n=1 Tax=Xenopus laevis TaxID=8355 RepID=A0A8J1M953_XENLA|nr:ralBP1-associated Eps domain-containing protein 2 isoform X2 [Xenopus laevis]